MCWVVLLPGLALAQAERVSAAEEAIEFSAENKALVAATTAFFDQVEARKRPKKRVPVIGVPLTVTKSRATKPATSHADMLTKMGPVDHLTGYRITWYPLDQLYGTVDFMGTWNGNRNLVCGYLTWDLSDPAAPVLETLSANFVDITALGAATTRQAHQSLLEANCAFGAIDANFRLFDVSG